MSKRMISAMVVAIVAGLILMQNASMPPENMELPKLTNPRLVVKKAARKLEVYDGRKLVKTYKMVLGFTPMGDKETEGDGKTPEGKFTSLQKTPRAVFISPWA